MTRPRTRLVKKAPPPRKAKKNCKPKPRPIRKPKAPLKSKAKPKAKNCKPKPRAAPKPRAVPKQKAQKKIKKVDAVKPRKRTAREIACSNFDATVIALANLSRLTKYLAKNKDDIAEIRKLIKPHVENAAPVKSSKCCIC